MRTWYTSDLHFGHQKVAEIRGFATTEAHDQAMMRLGIDAGCRNLSYWWVNP